MDFMVNLTKNFLDRFISGDLQNLRDIVLLAGLYYTTKFTLRIVLCLWTIVKTFILPLIWHRNFQDEYGPWAGNYINYYIVLLK